MFSGPFGVFHDSNFDYQKNIVRGEVELIIGMNTLHVIGEMWD